MPACPIIDSHVHFWDAAAVPISWTRGLAIDRPFRPTDFDIDRGGVEVEGIVFVEADVDPGHHVGEVDFVVGLADPRIQAIVAHAPLNAPSVAADLAQLAKRPLVRAVRQLIQGRDAVALTADPAFHAGLQQLPAHGFHFEIVITHDQLPPVIDLVAAMPGVEFVLNHIAKPGIKAGLREPWWQQIAALAACPNIVCKISGVATEANHSAWTEAEIRPYIDRAMEVFGPDRTMFGGDWPVMRLATDYPTWVGIVERALAPLSADEQRKVFAENARRVYRLPGGSR